MRLPLRIALRYLHTRRSFHFITIISFISIVGITIGIAALICVMSIFNGFRELTEQQIVGFDPHIRIEQSEQVPLVEKDSLLDLIKGIRGVKSAASVQSGKIVALNKNQLQVFNLKALSDDNEDFLQGISSSIIFGSFDISETGNMPGIVLGAALADRLGVLPNDTLSLMSINMIESSIRTYRKQAGVKAIVKGIYQTNQGEYDFMYAFSGTETGKLMFRNMASSVISIDIRLGSLENVDDVMNSLHGLLPEMSTVKTWKDLNSDLYRVMDFERMAAFAILSLIIIIAVFNVLASLSMTVVEKKADIAVLKAMGAEDNTIRWVFLWEGLLIGIISTFLGSTLGLGISWGQQEYGWFSIDSSKYIVSAIPVSIDLYSIVIVIIFSLLLSFLATLYPSWRAANSPILESIRSE